MSYKIYNRALIWDGAPHEEKELSALELKRLLKKNKALLIRNAYNFDCEDHTSFWYIIKDQFGGMAELSSKTRNQIKRALKLLDIKIVDKRLIIEQGYEVYLNSFKKYKDILSPPDSKDIFITGLQDYQPGEQFWGCIDKENRKLIAYAHNFVKDNMCDYWSLRAIPKYFTGYYPYYGLLYCMNNYYLNVLGLKYVTDGCRSITEHSNIQAFLTEKFKFRKSYCNLKINYDFRLKILIVLLFPFREYISNLKITILLRQEAISKGLYFLYLTLKLWDLNEEIHKAIF
jgi:hypothetical protein